MNNIPNCFCYKTGKGGLGGGPSAGGAGAKQELLYVSRRRVFNTRNYSHTNVLDKVLMENRGKGMQG